MMYWTALMLGLGGSLHCVGMCGPLALALPMPGAARMAMAWHSLQYQLGRAVTYTFLGLAFGALGQGIAMAGWQRGLSVGLGAAMLIAVVFSLPVEQYVLRLPGLGSALGRLKAALSKQLHQQGQRAAFTVGLLNGFLPCGLVYFALAGALATGHVLSAMLFMFLFGMGTWPLMFALTMAGGLASQPVRRRLRQASPVILFAFACLLLYRGLNTDVPLDLRFWAAQETPVMCH